MAGFIFEGRAINASFRLAAVAPGVKDRFLAIESSNFLRPGESATILMAISKLAAARRRLASQELSIADVINLARNENLTERPSINLINLGLTANEVTAAAIVETTFAAVSQTQALPMAERPILGIDATEWQALVAIQLTCNTAK